MADLMWVRLIDGRLWHVADGPGLAVCGVEVREVDDKVAERLPVVVPSGAWVCGRCVRELEDRARLARAALRGDPRRIPDAAQRPLAEVGS